MEWRKALSTEGRSEMRILCYGVFANSDMEGAIAHLREVGTWRAEVYELRDETWGYGAALQEYVLADTEEMASAIYGLLENVVCYPSCKVAICMYDGVFDGIESLFSGSLASQIYAFSFSPGSCVLALDDVVLRSQGWVEVVGEAKKRLDLCFSS
ncbi:MAG: hypothetical protein ACN6PV_15785 [Achromobacter sp.]|uniref:hypothetical protein n=1 Tax=Achromobacter sp. TaxID=134375 RepID=UPI003D06396F